MNEKVLKTLEYPKIISQLSDHASSPTGKKRCLSLLPMTDLQEILSAQQQTADATSRLLRKERLTFQGNYDLMYAFKHLELDGRLSQKELLQTAALLECAARVRSYGQKEHEDEPDDTLTELFDALLPLTQLTSMIRRAILSEEEISDDASSNLKSIRRSQISVNDKIHSQLNGMVNSTYRTYLQDAVITMRNNRYCIPVKSEYKSQVPGMVHDQSKAGSTFFIEPAAIVELNNKLQELFIKEQEEIEIILSTLSAQAGEHVTELIANHEILTQLDFVFAKAYLALEWNATMPIFNTQRALRIRKGRHPLIPKDRVVPIDIHLGDDFDLLVVTGPNTGGKTVSLKTVGLFCLLGQSGLHIPALDRSELCIFSEIYADIGDEQSIEQNLSTFSGHMTNVISILDVADEDALCLFDELGAGTDPTEGAALAIAILSFLHDRGIRTMATTHYSELKVFALSTDYVENACCEFNVETLRPTYRLLIGIPGKSNAFAISSRLGLSDEIIRLAKQQINEQDASFEDLLTDLEHSRVTIEKERAEIESYRREIESLKTKLSSKQEQLEQSKARILREANEEARAILQDAKDTADAAIRSIQKGGSIQSMEQSRTKLRNKISVRNEELSYKKQTVSHDELKPNQLKLGDSVQIVSLGLKGYVHTLPDAKGNLFIQCGIMRSQANIKDLILLQEDSPGTQTGKRSYQPTGFSKSASISAELNLLGKTVDEALSVLDKYLDDAYLSHLPSVRIVHGKGTGALRTAVSNHLRKLSYVKAFRLGEHGEGDAGVTIVEFK